MKKPEQQETKKRPAAGNIIGTIIRSIVVVIGFFFKIIFKACTLFGLWIPIVYSLFGVILYLSTGFNPFKFDTWGTLYLCGGIACIIGAAIIAIRNIIVKPVKSIYEGYKHPLWEKVREETVTEETRWEKYKRARKEDKLAPPEIKPYEQRREQKPVSVSNYGDLLAPLADFDAESLERDNSSSKNAKYSQKSSESAKNGVQKQREKPQIYFSALEPDVLVHEYPDRFELYKASGHKLTQIGVEYK